MAISDGSEVSIHYTGRLESGEVFDSSEGRGPLTFKVGAQQVIPGFEAGVMGMEVGDKKTVTIPPTEGYGERDDRLVQTINRDQLNVEEPQPGMVLGLETQDGQQMQATIHEVTDETITLDFNHMLAGKTLVFDIELVSVA